MAALKALGKDQIGFLAQMQANHGYWFTGCGWRCGSWSATARIGRSLVHLGLVTQSDTTMDYPRFDLTDQGRSYDIGRSKAP